ncbi:TniB family NTP-binding protein [Streptomyces sp. NPDC050423]|uniref:TniB family NTP-binding protein n=1 Tax=Streptomyces sp. NPDC050423 TaxID=3155402 RepID=UPI00344438FF
MLAFARKLHRRILQEEGKYTDEGHERWPVCRVGLTSNTGMRDFNRSILEYYGHPGRFRGTAADFGYRALDSVLSAETELLIVDDLHFLKWRNKNGIEVSNHFKYIANEFPVTLLLIGVGLEKRGLFSEGEDYEDAILAQTGRRTTRLGMAPFTIDSEKGRADWRNTLLAIEERVVLADKHPGMIADELSDYLFARSTGHIGSLMTLINRGCQRAVRTGVERLDKKLLNQVKNDSASEQARGSCSRRSTPAGWSAGQEAGPRERAPHPGHPRPPAARGKHRQLA